MTWLFRKEKAQNIKKANLLFTEDLKKPKLCLSDGNSGYVITKIAVAS